jgi:hypothetical protein
MTQYSSLAYVQKRQKAARDKDTSHVITHPSVLPYSHTVINSNLKIFLKNSSIHGACFQCAIERLRADYSCRS